MTIEEAKTILCLHRPGIDPAGSEVDQALELTEREPSLQQWYLTQQQLHGALRDKLRHLPVPETGPATLLRRARVVALPFRPSTWWAAAAALLLLAVGLWFLRPTAAGKFNDYRERIVRNAIRQYQMDIVTQDRSEVDRFLTTNGAPSRIPPSLSQLPVTGAGLLRWHNYPVAMVCFDRGDSNLLFLFVLDRNAVQDAPPAQPALTNINRLLTASWTSQTNTYILAGPPEPDFVRKYLSAP